MVQRLPYADKENPDPRGDLDLSLEVITWQTPSSKKMYRDPDAPLGAPQWWHGDEEATDTFLHGMGVKSIDELRR